MSRIIDFQEYVKQIDYIETRMKAERNKDIEMEKIQENPTDVIRRIRNDKKMKKDICRCADAILNAFEIDAFQHYVPIVKILNTIGIKTYKREMTTKELSAYISVDPQYYERYGTTKIACVNREDNPRHMRFALAHELGHYIFDYDETRDITYYNTYMKDSSEKDQTEKRANEFAANLLMPREQFIQKKKYFEEKTNYNKPEVVVALASHFGVLTTSIQKRYLEVETPMS